MSAGLMGAQDLESIRAENSGEHTSKQSLYFSSDSNRLFGWLHRPVSNSTADIGLVLCNPFGYESICAHRTVRAFAEAAASIGVPALRFDYAGTGDSSDIDSDANQIDVWSRDVVSAVSELQKRTGVAKVYLLGFRLGALLATLATSRCNNLGGLLVIAPIISGRRLLRELRTARLAAGLRATDAVDSPSSTQVTGPGTGSLEFTGFSLSAASISALSQIDLEDSGSPAVSRMLIVDRNDLPVASKWGQRLATLGMNVEYIGLPDFVEIIMRQAETALIPHAMIAATCNWLQQQVSEEQRGSRPRPQSCHRLSETPEVLSLPASEPLSSLTERPVSVSTSPFLFGIVTEPRSGEMRRRAVILLNGGGVNHMGIFRIWVSFSRLWAQRGYVVMRLDLAGIGDSDTRPGRPDNEAFPPAALDDIRRAIEFMGDRYGIRDITLAGICSGAYHALRAAAAGLPVSRILMVNPQNFFWREGMTVEDMEQLTEAVLNPGGYRKRLLSIADWKRLITGQVQIWKIPRALINRALMVFQSRLRNMARRLGVRLPRDLGSELEQIVGRGVRVVMVFARGEPGIDLLRIQAGTSIRRLGDRVHIHIVDGADHDFSQSGPRSILEQILSDELHTRSAVSTSP